MGRTFNFTGNARACCNCKDKMNPTKKQCFEWAWEQFCDTVFILETCSGGRNRKRNVNLWDLLTM